MSWMWLVLGTQQIHGDLAQQPPAPLKAAIASDDSRGTWKAANPLQIRAQLAINGMPIGEVYPGKSIVVCGFVPGKYQATWQPPSGTATTQTAVFATGDSACLVQLVAHNQQSTKPPMGDKEPQ